MRPISMARLRFARRAFLKFIAADAALVRLFGASQYNVGVGDSTDPYSAATTAIQACGDWPPANIAGATVMVKPNLVASLPSTSGATTDPQVVRAIVDLALAAGAAQVYIAEGGVNFPANFSACGYDIFNGYDPRVELMDFSTQPYNSVPVPSGLAYQSLYLPTPALQPNLIFISAGKLKCHVNAVVSLSMKNLFGLAAPPIYTVTGPLPRQDLHLRGVDESIVDLNLARPISFAVIDGIWGMAGNGPIGGTAVPVNTVLAGLNPVAVDRAGLLLMEVQRVVPHLTYASALGLGPADSSTITLRGDLLQPVLFTPAQTGPVVWRPIIVPASLSISDGQSCTITYRLPQACSFRIQVIQDSDSAPAVTVVRTLMNWTTLAAGTASISWNGYNDAGVAVAPGTYLVQFAGCLSSRFTYATARVTVTS